MKDTLDSFERYMSTIQGIPHLTPDEEKDLAAAIINGDVLASHKMVGSHLLLVVKIAHEFKGLGLSLQDLVSEGNSGLMHATEMFDPSKGARLSTYSKWWIKDYMRKALSNLAYTIRVPAGMSGRLSEIVRIRKKLKDELGRDPNDQEVADEMGVSKRKITVVTHVADRSKMSLDDTVIKNGNGSGNTTFNDFFADENSETSFEEISRLEDMQRIDLLFADLEDKEKDILNQRYGLNGIKRKTLEEISKADGRSKERIRQIQEAALKKLKHWYELEPLRMTA